MVEYPELAAIRLGYGLSALVPPPAGPASVLASVEAAAPDRFAITMDKVRAMQGKAADLNSRVRDGDDGARKEGRELRNRVAARANRANLRRVTRALDAPVGFGERLVQFWSDHFTVSGGNAFYRLAAAALVDEAIRPNLGGRFEDMLFAATTHPRMLTYLDQYRSVGPHSAYAERRQGKKPGLNENLAREMIELHSLGVGAEYTQKDVRQLAELLTGLVYEARNDRIFEPARAEPGAEIVLGRSYGDDSPARLADIRAVTRDLARHPATAQHIARKLAVHFVADDPPQSLLDRLAGIYADSGGELGLVYAELVVAPELAETFRQKVRQPFDFLVASLRALGMRGGDLLAMDSRRTREFLLRAMTPMGQTWGSPRGPDGWPEEAEAWATPQGLAARIDWATRVPGKLQPDLPDPRALMQTALGDTASEALQWAVPKAETRRDGLVIVLASADFNRR